MDINKDSLETALNNSAKPAVSTDQEIGYHQGAINTLVSERNELLKMAQVVESLIQAHAKRLEELGYKFEKK